MMNEKQVEAALRLAREALKESHPEAYRHTITAIDEALAEQPAQPSQSRSDVKPWVHASTWRGLTDDDIQQVRENCGITHHAIKTIEDKLRELNEHKEKNA